MVERETLLQPDTEYEAVPCKDVEAPPLSVTVPLPQGGALQLRVEVAQYDPPLLLEAQGVLVDETEGSVEAEVQREGVGRVLDVGDAVAQDVARSLPL